MPERTLFDTNPRAYAFQLVDQGYVSLMYLATSALRAMSDDAVRVMLRDYEMSPMDDSGRCPDCGTDDNEHHPECELGAAIVRAECEAADAALMSNIDGRRPRPLHETKGMM